MILSVLAFAIMNAIVKYLTAFGVYQIVFRSVGTLAFTVPLILKYKILFLVIIKTPFIRGLIGVISLTTFLKL